MSSRGRSAALRLKRVFDFCAAALLLVILLPVLSFIGLLVWLVDGRPIFFRQLRPGYRGKPFVALKFRTMSQALDAAGNPLADERRLTKFGRMLRAASLDELPQLWGVLKGEMSLVGPRPLLMQYLGRYTGEQARRHEMLPGMTGWAQVNGRNATNWPDRLAMDVWYVDHWSLALDARILLKTLLHVFKREGISARGHATMPEFMGNEGSVAQGK